MDKFSIIPFFIAVVETGSFSNAAKKLSVTKSAVSKRISQYEDDLGIRLLHRTTRKISLTDAGLKYYEYIKAANSLIQEGEDTITTMQRDIKGVLKITVPTVFGRLHISPIISKFLEQNPSIELDITMDDQTINLVEEGLDMAIRIGKLEDSSLVARCLSPCTSVICASPTYLEKYGTPSNLDELGQHNCMIYSYYRGGDFWTFDSPHGREYFLPKGRLKINNSEGLYDALLAGVGICQMPNFIVAPALKDGRLIPILTDYILPIHHIFAVYPQRRFMPEKVRKLLEFFMHYFGESSEYQTLYEN